jgi:hypothetical protein
MGQLIAAEFVRVDGVAQAPEGPEGGPCRGLRLRRLAGAVCHASGGENLIFVRREGEIKIGDAAPNLTQQGRSYPPRT